MRASASRNLGSSLRQSEEWKIAATCELVAAAVAPAARASARAASVPAIVPELSGAPVRIAASASASSTAQSPTVRPGWRATARPSRAKGDSIAFPRGAVLGAVSNTGNLSFCSARQARAGPSPSGAAPSSPAQPVATPASRPIAEVNAIARPPPIETRSIATQGFAPPSRPPIAPSSASSTRAQQPIQSARWPRGTT